MRPVSPVKKKYNDSHAPQPTTSGISLIPHEGGEKVMEFESTTRSSCWFPNFIKQCQGCAIIDGGMATELERYGINLNDQLWSAKCIFTSPNIIRKVHLDYLEAGANILVTSSYQATLEGFEGKGFSRDESEALLRKSVEITCEARDAYYARIQNFEEDGRASPILVAASIGSYGACLADGSEYHGNYGGKITIGALKDFHRRRMQILADSGADLIAFETIPNKLEAKAYAELLEEEELDIPVWFSFVCKDEARVVSGDTLEDCAMVADACKNTVAIGVNCTPPRYITHLINSIQKVSAKPILVYPNSGETYDADQKVWLDSKELNDNGFASSASEWRRVGASLVGGCCRTSPTTIRAIASSLGK